MNDIDGWVYFDGAEPEHLRPLLDALRELPPSTPEDKQRMARRLVETLDAAISQRGEPSVATGAQIVRVEGERRGGEAVVTARSPTFDERAATPPGEPIVPLRPVDAWEPRPAEVRPAEDLTTIEIAVQLPVEVWEQMGRLPFKPRAPGEVHVRTLEVPVMNPRKGETEPLWDDSIAKAVPALPFVGNTIGARVVPFPRLNVTQYASLRAELLVWPERSAAILPRYHVMNEAARRALEEHWANELAVSPQARATFDKALADYTAWLRARGNSCSR